MTRPTCETCAAWRRGDGATSYANQGQCKRFAPAHGWPITLIEDDCLDHVPAVPPEPMVPVAVLDEVVKIGLRERFIANSPAHQMMERLREVIRYAKARAQ